MATFEILANTTGIDYAMEDDPTSIVGFYSTHRVVANDQEEAVAEAMKVLQSDELVSDIISSSKEKGCKPKLEVEGVYQLSWLRSLLPYKKKGLIFYDDSDS